MKLLFFLCFFITAFGLCRDGGTILYAVDGAGGFRPSKLYILDVTDGSVLEEVGEIGTGYNHTVCIESNPLDKQLYAIDNTDIDNGVLLEIDEATGHSTLVGATGAQIPDIGFSPEGILYGWRESPAPQDELVRINIDTAHLTQIGTSGLSTFQTGVAVGLDNTIWLKSDDELYRLNSDGTIAEMIMLSQQTSNILAFDSDGTLYTGSRDPLNSPDENTTFTLQTIDIDTGVVTDVGSPIQLPIAGIAFGCDSGTENLPLIILIVALSVLVVVCIIIAIVRIRVERSRPVAAAAYENLMSPYE